jgi:hypothetical protein
MPVCNYDGEVIGVAQIINKRGGNDHEFTDSDIKVRSTGSVAGFWDKFFQCIFSMRFFDAFFRCVFSMRFFDAFFRCVFSMRFFNAFFSVKI